MAGVAGNLSVAQARGRGLGSAAHRHGAGKSRRLNGGDGQHLRARDGSPMFLRQFSCGGGWTSLDYESARPRLRLTERGKEELWASCGCLYFYIISTYGKKKTPRARGGATMAPRQLWLEPTEVNSTADKGAKRVRVES
eukprot:scaffold407_cov130-Isochrysis_galbana.AAC.5